MKIYLGDAVYAEINEDSELILTTENGISETNRIVLEPQVLDSLVTFLEHTGVLPREAGGV